MFATDDLSNTRVIIGNSEADITVNIKSGDYVLTNAVIDPSSKNNISTYIVKENIPISFNLANADINREDVQLRNFYYRTIKNKNIIIRCKDSHYIGGDDVSIVPNYAYNSLKSKNKLNNCLIIMRLEYEINPIGSDVKNESEDTEKKYVDFAFKIVSSREFDMYKTMEEEKNKEDEDEGGEIKRPKKVSN